MSEWWYWNKEAVIAIVLLVAFIALMFGGAYYFSQASCDAKTVGMGFNHAWSVLGGCRIEVNPGHWIPLDSYYFKQE